MRSNKFRGFKRGFDIRIVIRVEEKEKSNPDAMGNRFLMFVYMNKKRFTLRLNRGGSKKSVNTCRVGGVRLQ